MRFIFLGSPPFAVPILSRLLDSPHVPELLVTPPARRRGRGRKLEASLTAQLAQDAGVPVLQPESVRDASFLDTLRGVEADVFLVVSYGELLRQEFLDLPRDVCLNIHPSLLPRHRGASPVQAAILAGDEVTGTSVQRVVLELDAGDVLAQQECRVERGETAGELAERLAALSAELVIEALDAVADKTAVYTPQDPARVTHCRKLEKDQGRIDWTREAPELERHVLGMNPWPSAFTSLPDGTALRIHRARAVSLGAGGDRAPGSVLSTESGLVVACGPSSKGALEVTELQVAGKRALSAAEFLRGARLTTGDVLGEPA